MSGSIKVVSLFFRSAGYSFFFSSAVCLSLVVLNAEAQNSAEVFSQPVISLWLDGDPCETSIRVGDNSFDAFSNPCSSLMTDDLIIENHIFSHKGGPLHIDIVSAAQRSYDTGKDQKNTDTNVLPIGLPSSRDTVQNAQIVVEQGAGRYTAQISRRLLQANASYKFSIYQGSLTSKYADSINSKQVSTIQPSGSIANVNNLEIDRANELDGRENGFSFVKISDTGTPLDVSSSDWRCVKDDLTGLMWEVKTQNRLGIAPDLHDIDHTYSWYSDKLNDSDASRGFRDGGICFADNGARCDTQGFVDAVNDSNSGTGLCGFSDWRLPTLAELRGLVNHNIVSPAIDTVFFPSVSANFNTFFWSSSPNLSEIRNMWGVSFSFGYVSDGNKSLSRAVRLVRGGHEEVVALR